MKVFVRTKSKTVADFDTSYLKMISVRSQEKPISGKRVSKVPSAVVIKFSGERFYEYVENTSYEGSIRLSKGDVEAM